MNQQGVPHCLLCHREEGVILPPIWTRTHEVVCPRCGHFFMSFEAVLSMQALTLPQKAPLMAVLREREILGLKPLTVTISTDYGIPQETFAKTIPEKVDRLLVNLSRLAPDAGNKYALDPERDFPLGHCTNRSGLEHVRDILVSSGWLERDKTDDSLHRLTLAGWARAGELQKGAIDSSTVFVAMSFKPEWDGAWKDGIRPAIEEDCGYKALRVDAVEHTEDINDRIIAEIRRSKFMVADFSSNPGGVYLEAGFEMGLGRTVIWTCQDDDERKKALHFDISHYNFIFWKDPEDLRTRLRDRILALFGEGPRPKAVGDGGTDHG